MEFYKVLQQIMEEKRLGIADVARLCNLSDSTVRSIFDRKQKKIALNTAFKLSEGLSVSLNRLNGEPEVNTNDRKGVIGFPERLKQYMEENDLTYEEMSTITGFPVQTLNRYALGQRAPKITDFLEIAEKLNVNPLWLQGLVNDIKPITVPDDGLDSEHIELLKSLSKADLDIVLSVARQMKQREDESKK